MEDRGWEACDFIFVSGDAYVDHPAFAAALICRVLEDTGYRVGIIPQPDWTNRGSYTVLGRPRLGFLVGAGNMDSLVAHYTAAKKPRSEDAYSPGGKAGLRPDRATITYVAGIRSVYKNIPVIIGGIEASLRRFAHYDYWSNQVRRSLLLDAKADILVYGMGEQPIRDIAYRLQAGEPIAAIQDLRGTCVRAYAPSGSAIVLPEYEAIRGTDRDSLRRYAEHFMIQRAEADPLSARPLAERSDGDRWVIQNPPAFPLSSQELDRLYVLPYTRRAHPQYDAAGGIPALKEMAFSLVSSRGCFGGCSFCAITFHQGRAVTGRSPESLLCEAKILSRFEGFKGYIHDLGGPTANFYRPPCARQTKGGFCADRECLFPQPCPHLKGDHREYLQTLEALRAVEGIRKVFIRSGIRFDYLCLDSRYGQRFLKTLCRFHVSGQLKVAPEHVASRVLTAMGKGDHETYLRFAREYREINRSLGSKQYLVPYFISGHPGSTLQDGIALALYLKKSRFIPNQVQDFYPTPGTLSTVMYRTGLDPRTMEPIFVPGEREKRLQRALVHFNKPENHSLVREALHLAHREDLLEPGPDRLL
jgi:uncharacterized radical SAM protein YgiQ